MWVIYAIFNYDVLDIWGLSEIFNDWLPQLADFYARFTIGSIIIGVATMLFITKIKKMDIVDKFAFLIAAGLISTALVELF